MTPHHVPPPALFRCLHALKTGHAVVEKTTLETGRVCYQIVRRVPRSNASDLYPGSALTEFNSPAQAINLLNRWAADPVPPREIYPAEPASNHRRDPRRLRPRTDDFYQLIFNL
jgi:hypothetical protein